MRINRNPDNIRINSNNENLRHVQKRIKFNYFNESDIKSRVEQAR